MPYYCERCGYRGLECVWEDRRAYCTCGVPLRERREPDGGPRRRINPTFLSPLSAPDDGAPAAAHVAPSQAGARNLFDQHDPPPVVRLMVWNLETLGGGMRKGPRRSEAVMRATAAVLYLIRPDICAILEVMSRTRVKPKKRRSPDSGYTRKRRKKKQKVEAPAEAAPAPAEHPHPGLEEVERLRDMLNQIAQEHGDAARWACTTDASAGPCGGDYTGSIKNETYAYLYRSEAGEIAFAPPSYIDEEYPPGSGKRLGFPNGRFRRPMLAEFTMSGRFAPGIAPWTLPFLAFHAPAPSHPERYEAISNLALIQRLNLGPEMVVGADSNVDAESLQPGLWEQAIVCLDYGLDEELSKRGIDRWTGEDVARTSLRRKPILHADVPGSGGRLEDGARPLQPGTFLNCAYDKLWLFTKNLQNGDIDPRSRLRNPDVHVFDLVVAAQKQATAGLAAPSDTLEYRRSPVSNYAGCLCEILETQPTDADAIDAANSVSDHSPVYMIAEVLGVNRFEKQLAPRWTCQATLYFVDGDEREWYVLRGIPGEPVDSFFQSILWLWPEDVGKPDVMQLRQMAACPEGLIDDEQLLDLATVLRWCRITLHCVDENDTEIKRVSYGDGDDFAFDVLVLPTGVCLPLWEVGEDEIADGGPEDEDADLEDEADESGDESEEGVDPAAIPPAAPLIVGTKRKR